MDNEQLEHPLLKLSSDAFDKKVNPMPRCTRLRPPHRSGKVQSRKFIPVVNAGRKA
jgi:hypothetical protein